MVGSVDDVIDLPPGFRFHPTDEEIVTHYLCPKVQNHSFTSRAMGEVDLNKCEPWDLPSKAKMGEKEWYFFCQRDRKYPTGMRTNRATEAGYWKATGKDKEIYRGRGILVGMKKTLVFYRGRAPKGEKTNWVMHEFRLEGKSTFSHLPKSSKDEWVVCRVFHKSNGAKKGPFPMPGLSRTNSLGDNTLFDSPTLPPLMDPPYFDGNNNDADFDIKGSSFSSMLMGMDDGAGYQPTGFSSGMMNPGSSSAGLYSQVGQIPPPPSHYFPMPPGSAALAYLHQDQAMLRALVASNDAASVARRHYDAASAARRHCKVEQLQLPNQSILSDDTGLSTDRNTEISSVVSKLDMASCASFDDIDVPSSAGPVLDLDNMWKC